MKCLYIICMHTWMFLCTLSESRKLPSLTKKWQCICIYIYIYNGGLISSYDDLISAIDILPIASMHCNTVEYGLVLWHINHCRLFNTQSFFIHIYRIYDFKTHFVDNIFKRAWTHFFHKVNWFHLFLSNTNKIGREILEKLRVERIK